MALIGSADARQLDTALLRAAIRSPAGDVRAAAALAVGQVQGRALAPALRSLLTDGDTAVAAAAAFALGLLRDTAGIDALAAALAPAPAVGVDAAWALGQVRERFGHLPACLVGHSLGGRAALIAGGAEEVRSVVALNPWVYPTDAPDLSGRRVLFVHGTGDRIADPGRAEAVARRIGRTADMEFVAVPEGRHAMLRHGSVFERAAADFATATLLPKYPKMGEVCP